MKRNVFFMLLTFVIMYGCSDDKVNVIEQCFSISSKDIADNSLVNGGQYQVIDQQGKVLGTYNLQNGTISIDHFAGGTYTIKEITAPKGYDAIETEKLVNLSDKGCQDVVFQYVNEESREIPDNMKVKFYGTDSNNLLGEYNAVRIGEYYWIDRNFYHIVPWGNDYENSLPITQALLDRYVERILINPSQFKLNNVSDFEKYYGRHYCYSSILYMNNHGQMRNEYDEILSGWKLPNHEDYRQLFGMCPFNTTYDSPHIELNERDVRFALGAKNGDNPMAYNITDPDNELYHTYWFDNKHVTNMYGFNLMPGGARLNGNSQWCNELGGDNGCYPDGKKGDIYHLFYTAPLAVIDKNDGLAVGTVTIHDLVDTYHHVLYHLLNVRWCRKLSDTELGYRLYINSDQTDIIKLDLNEQAPKGYKELPNGYTRGFYVQYILNNPNPAYTVKDVVNFAREVMDMHVYYNKNNKDVIL